MSRVVAVFNPMSRGGRAQKELPGLQTLVDQVIAPKWGPVEWRPTQKSGDAKISAREAAIEGAELVLSVGGDGTHSNVLNGFLDDNGNPVNARSRMGIIHLGTGGDFRKSLGIGANMRESLEAIAQNSVRTIDIGKITFHGDSGKYRLSRHRRRRRPAGQTGGNQANGRNSRFYRSNGAIVFCIQEPQSYHES
jgi:diacylglycerol kinase (ATP)